MVETRKTAAKKATAKKAAPRKAAAKKPEHGISAEAEKYLNLPPGGVKTDAGGRPVMDEGGRPVNKDG